jgi:outer membrane protein assembly factor BamC
MEEVIQGPADAETALMWRPRPSDPELEAEMLKRLMVQLGVEQQRAEQLLAAKREAQPDARMVQDKDGATVLILADPFPQAWRRTGIALDRVGFVVEDRNRSDGLYFVKYDDPEEDGKKRGFLSKLNPFGGKKNGESEKYQVRLSAKEGETLVVVLSDSGKQDDSKTARRILGLLYDQLK